MFDELISGKVTSIQSIGEGLRVCIDFIDELDPLEGVWIGNTGTGYCLALAENRETDTYPKRPFRVNAGAYHHYVVKENDETIYLAEVKPGNRLTVSNSKKDRLVTVGRVKKEYRSLTRIELEVKETIVSVTVQDADSVYLINENEAVQAQRLQVGDHLTVKPDQPGRHLGQRIDEEITEV